MLDLLLCAHVIADDLIIENAILNWQPCHSQITTQKKDHMAVANTICKDAGGGRCIHHYVIVYRLQIATRANIKYICWIGFCSRDGTNK